MILHDFYKQLIMRNEQEIKDELEKTITALETYEDFDEEGYGTYKGWIQALKWVLGNEK